MEVMATLPTVQWRRELALTADAKAPLAVIMGKINSTEGEGHRKEMQRVSTDQLATARRHIHALRKSLWNVR